MRWLLALSLLVWEAALADRFQARDDTGELLTLAARPDSIVSLSPHLTEILFSLGVGDHIVATVEHADFPDAARAIPRLGDAFSLGIEAVVALSPDLIVAWATGGNQRTLYRLRALGYPVYLNEAATLEDIAASVSRLGRLVGEKARGDILAARFTGALADLRAANAGLPPVRVFFQISDSQLYTVNDTHLIGQAIGVCGADNVFGDLAIKAPVVSFESVVGKAPDLIVVSAPREGFESRWQSHWRRLSWEGRVRRINASLITRPGLRMIQGMESLCKTLRE